MTTRRREGDERPAVHLALEIALPLLLALLFVRFVAPVVTTGSDIVVTITTSATPVFNGELVERELLLQRQELVRLRILQRDLQRIRQQRHARGREWLDVFDPGQHRVAGRRGLRDRGPVVLAGHGQPAEQRPLVAGDPQTSPPSPAGIPVPASVDAFVSRHDPTPN